MVRPKKTSFTGELTRFYVTSYKTYLLEGDFQINTINKKINSLHAFNLFLMTKGLCHEKAVYPNRDKIKIATGSEHEIQVLTDEEVEKILFYFEGSREISQRDKVCVYLLLYTGVRVSELVGVKIRDIDLLSLSLKVIGKGGKYREIPLKPEVAQVVKAYLEGERRQHKKADSEYLILTQRAGKADKDTINKLLRKHGKELNLTLYPHKFRHSFCTMLTRKGIGLEIIAQLAGHASITTTAQFYVNVSKKNKHDAVNLL